MAKSISPDRLVDLVSKHDVTIFVGKNDTGKSTLIRQIAGSTKSCILDSDIGQSDIGPPATVSLGVKEDHGYRMADGYFCGSVSPSGHFLQLLAGVSRMMRLWPATGKKLLVNTTGLVSGDIGRTLVTEKINAIRPDLIIAIETDSELKYLDAFTHADTNVIHMKPMHGVRIKSKSERTEAREASFREHFEGAVVTKHNLWDIGIERSLLNNGRPVEKTAFGSFHESDIVYAEVLGSEAIVVYNGQMKEPGKLSEELGVKTIYACKPDDFHGVLLGLLGATGHLSALGLLDSIDFSAGTVNVFSKTREFSIMQFGSMKLNSKDFSSCGTFRPETCRHNH